jgi:hypothetical protein
MARPKGSPNKRQSLCLAKFLNERGINHLERLIDLLPQLEPAEQAKIYLKMHEYIEPKAFTPIFDENDESKLKEIPTQNLIAIVRANSGTGAA